MPKEDFKSIGTKEIVLGGEQFILRYNPDLDVIEVRTADAKFLPTTDLYWFAWYAYHPDTQVLAG